MLYWRISVKEQTISMISFCAGSKIEIRRLTPATDLFSAYCLILGIFQPHVFTEKVLVKKKECMWYSYAIGMSFTPV